MNAINPNCPQNHRPQAASTPPRRFRWKVVVPVVGVVAVLLVVLIGWLSDSDVKGFLNAADSGDARAQFFMGERYLLGKGVKVDKAEAVKWLRKAADQGDSAYPGPTFPRSSSTAKIWLGDRYFYGDGVSMDKAEGARWYRKAADQGDDMAQHLLGACYANGDGVPMDKAEAMKWFQKAAVQGNVKAKAELDKSR